MRREFPDAIDIFGADNLKVQFGPTYPKALPLVTVRCFPHTVNNSVIVGDAAHAIVPFYGQERGLDFFKTNHQIALI